jgi:antitoxin (DNA-binding transcriptional repressor) of toxin-antitoxin stability system
MTISIEQAQVSLKELIAKTSQGEKVVITQDQLPVAELVPASGEKLSPVFGSCRGMLTVVADDEGHLLDFTPHSPTKA